MLGVCKRLEVADNIVISMNVSGLDHGEYEIVFCSFVKSHNCKHNVKTQSTTDTRNEILPVERVPDLQPTQ